MDKTHIRVIGKKLRQTFIAPDDLPFPMRKALEALGEQIEELPVTRGQEGGVRNLRITVGRDEG